jgi:hypothetical protein
MTAVKARVFAPQCSVLLIKNVARKTVDGEAAVSDRFSGTERVIDLAPWLSDSSGIRTSKSVREAAGGFSLTLADRRHPISLDSLYGLIEPMDLIEIRMSHTPHEYTATGDKLPIIMRGVVTSIRRTESMASSGKPARQVVVSGQDYGKFWQILQIFYMPNYPAGANLLTQFKAFAQYGVGFATQSARAFLVDVVEKIINPFISDMRSSGEGGSNPDVSPLVLLQADDDDVQGSLGVVSPFGINQWNGGTVYQLLRSHLDVGPWCELFIEDREDGVHVVYRNVPFYGTDGNQIGEFEDPDVIDVPAADVVSLSLDRSDEDVANYFWVDAPRYEMVNGPILRAVAASGDESSYFLQDHHNANPKIYGVRKMWVQTQQGAASEWTSGAGAKEATVTQIQTLSESWITSRRTLLAAYNKDNVVFEDGSIRLRGREDIRAGVYVRLYRGSMTALYYVVEVSHEFIPFSGFFSTLRVVRGTGFIERAKRSGGLLAPYNSELTDV